MLNPNKIIKLIPTACEWIETQEALILEIGVPLSQKLLEIASKIGIKDVSKIRLLSVASVPEPEDAELNKASKMIGLISSNTLGVAFRYGIYIREDFWDDESLIIHELTHTMQYERLGGISNFMNQYIKECIIHGYNGSPLEKEARSMEAMLAVR